MYYVYVDFTLLLCVYFTNAFWFYGTFNNNKYFLKELDTVIGHFEASTKLKTIEQPLNHFDEKETRTFKMRYFERLDLWKLNGPIYLFINGEWEANDAFLKTGILYELAKETNGAIYSSEHRYYGKSMPFKNLTTDNLAYLSSRQALADTAKLLREIKKIPKYEESKVVVVGGSYSGNLAAWLKVLYPELVDAAIASSAPVLAKKDFYEYLEAVSDDFEQYGTAGCHDKIRQMFKRYNELFLTDTGIRQLVEEEEICNDTDMTKSENKQLFFSDKMNNFMYEAQYGNPESIQNFCDEFQNASRQILFKNKYSDSWNQKKDCFDYDFDSLIEDTKKANWVMTWLYQTCTEFGYFMSTSSENHPFTDNVSLELFYSICTKLYGAEFDEERVNKGIESTNNLYGGLQPNVTKVVFVNGDLDPWSRLGVLEDISYDAPAKIIPRSSHCRDLLSNKSKDSEELKEARAYIKYLIKKWIGADEYKKP